MPYTKRLRAKDRAEINSDTYLINGETVSRYAFMTFVETLTIVPGSQVDGEGPRGLTTSYWAQDHVFQTYIVTLNGHEHSVVGPIP